MFYISTFRAPTRQRHPTQRQEAHWGRRRPHTPACPVPNKLQRAVDPATTTKDVPLGLTSTRVLTSEIVDSWALFVVLFSSAFYLRQGIQPEPKVIYV